jgi:ectoine hydroxylase-related dioxygenase (phytanoyl-CoA dioxygenase family)
MEDIDTIVEDYSREGWIHLPGILTREEVKELRAGIERMLSDPTRKLTNHTSNDWTGVRLYERERIFRDMLVREPLITVAEGVVGENCHLISDGAVFNPPGKAISKWHVDDGIYFPLPDGIERFDERISMPNLICNFQLLLSDVPSIEYGPTQVVPGSHYSGRPPPTQADPAFEGRGAVSFLGNAGDLFLQHPQTWHRGAPNTSDRKRCLYQIAYGDRRIAPRLFPFLNYRFPDHVLDGAGTRLLRLFGKHPTGAYG